MLCQHAMSGHLLWWLVAAGNHDDGNLSWRTEATQGDGFPFKDSQMLGHCVEALRLTPEGLNDGMNVWRKLPNFAHKPLERSRYRRTKYPHEPAWCGRYPATQESETCPDDANVREHGAYA